MLQVQVLQAQALVGANEGFGLGFNLNLNSNFILDDLNPSETCQKLG